MPVFHRRFSSLPLWLLFLLLLSGVFSARAEGDITAVLYPPQLDEFPMITAYLDLRAAQGEFIKGLGHEQIRIVENGDYLELTGLEELRMGAQFALVINPGPPFAIRDAQGRSRFDRLVEGLQKWAQNQTARGDQDFLSLFAPGGFERVHLENTLEWVEGLESYSADFRSSQPNFDILTRAVDMAGIPLTRPAMGRGVLLVTSPPEGNLEIGVQTLAERARQQGVHISVWLVSSSDHFDSPGSLQLSELAHQTGGGFFTFSGVEDFPDLDDYLERIRDGYRIQYKSRALTQGEHQVNLEIKIGGETLTTQTRDFSLDIQPPNPILLSVPDQIQRVGVLTNRSNEIDISPPFQELEILVDFPDGKPRSIISSFLLVDGEIADDNHTHPFDKFQWDISKYTESGVHIVQVHVVDDLGLSGSSIEIPVTVSVVLPKRTIWMVIAQNGTLLAGFSVVFSGAILLIVFIVGGRLNPARFRKGLRNEPPTNPLRVFHPGRSTSDPLTQPVRGADEKLDDSTGRLPQWINRLPWPQRQVSSPAFAYLMQFSETDKGANPTPIPLTVERVIFGRDPFKAGIVLQAASVESVHARLEREGPTYRLSDAGSVAGTWVNYTPVSQEGTLLEHGDLIHIGRVGFRFTLHASARKAVITPKEPES
jgi:hypothetical protein